MAMNALMKVSNNIFICLDQPYRPASRSNYSTVVTRILTKWFEAHIDNPYPTEEERVEICEKTGLTRKQLRVWLINSRKVRAFEPISII